MKLSTDWISVYADAVVVIHEGHCIWGYRNGDVIFLLASNIIIINSKHVSHYQQ